MWSLKKMHLVFKPRQLVCLFLLFYCFEKSTWSQRRTLWSKCLRPAVSFSFFLMFKMPTDAQQSVASRVSRHFKRMERSQCDGSQRRAINASLSSHSTFSQVLIGRKQRERKKKAEGFYMGSLMYTCAPIQIESCVNFALDGSSDSRIRYSHIWTTGNAKSGSRIAIRQDKMWAID